MNTRLAAIALLLVLMLTSGATAVQNWDVRVPDTIRIGTLSVDDYPWPDSIALPIYIWADDTVAGFSLGFRSSDPLLQITSFSSEGSIFNQPSCVWTDQRIDPVLNGLGFGWYDATGNWKVNPQGLIGNLYLRIDPSLPGASAVDIDSTFIAPALYFEMITVVSGYIHAVRPAPFADVEGANILFADAFICGDADGNALINIADAVYLVSYIFGGGSPPDPLLAGDADCNAIVNIADAVYLISYIFGGGPAPCEACPRSKSTEGGS